MQIYGPFRVSTTNNTSSVQRAQTQKPDQTDANRNSGPVDQLDLTSSAAATNRLDGASPIAGNGEIRIDRVAEIRRQIADGTYETPEKMDIALGRMLDQFA